MFHLRCNGTSSCSFLTLWTLASSSLRFIIHSNPTLVLQFDHFLTLHAPLLQQLLVLCNMGTQLIDLRNELLYQSLNQARRFL